MGQSLSATAKGRRIVLLAKRVLEARGAVVEIAPNVVRWIKLPAGKMVPRSMRHDLFGLFDILAAYPEGHRALYQVTTLGNLSHRRRKMLAALPPFPFHGDDAILAYVPGRRRHFRVCYADAKFEWRAIVWSVPPDVKKSRVRALGSEIPAGAA